MGICTKCGYLSDDGVHGVSLPEQHDCSASENKALMKELAKLLFKVIVYADPASTAGQKSAALTYIQTRRTWVEANLAKLQDFIN